MEPYLADTLEQLYFHITMQIISNKLKLFDQSIVIEVHKSGHFNNFVSGIVKFVHHIH